MSVYVWRQVGMLGQNLLDLSQSLSGEVFTCWDKTPLIDMYVGSKLLRPVLCSATFGLLQCDLAASLPWQLQ